MLQKSHKNRILQNPENECTKTKGILMEYNGPNETIFLRKVLLRLSPTHYQVYVKSITSSPSYHQEDHNPNIFKKCNLTLKWVHLPMA